jgi:ubiquinone/menaquinone biosynthesis C-methylase UbiE
VQKTETKGDIDYLEEFLRLCPVFHALLRAIECRNMAEVDFDPPILDLGCGDGMFGSILFEAEPGGITFGIDLRLNDIKKASATGAYRMLQMADIQRLPFADNSIGSIFSNSVFEHLVDIDSALSEAARVLKPGGRLVFTSPNSRLVDKFLSARILHSMGLSGAARAMGRLGNRVLGNQTCLSNEQWREKSALAGFSSVDCRYMIPPKVFHISEVFMPFGVFSILAKRLFGRMLFMERRVFLQPLHRFLKEYYRHDDNSGGLASVIISKK